MDLIRIIFDVDTPYGVYRDALHLPPDHTLSQEEIDAMKQARVDNWIALITAPQPSVIDPLIEEVPQDG